MADQYIWVNKWDEFQTFQTKRGRPWAPPWFKIYTHLLDEHRYVDLPVESRSLLVGLFILFARSHGTVTKDTRNLSRSLHQRVTERQLERLSDAGWVSFCSGTVLEQRRAAFWNRSGQEENRQEQNTLPNPDRELGSVNGRASDLAEDFPLPELRRMPL